MSDSNACSIAAQRETSWGTVAAPLALQKVRFTGDSLEHEKFTVVSKEIRDDRQTDESVEVGVMVKGGFDFELSVGDLDLWLESALMGTFDEDGLLINGSTETSWCIEKKFTSASFVSMKGLMVDTLALKFASRAIVEGSLGFIGLKGVSAAATIDTSGTYTAQGTGLLLSASANVGTVTIGGVAVSSIKSLDINLTNNLRGNDVIGKKEIDEVGVGEIGVSGTINAYFRTRTLMEVFFNHTYVELVLSVSREAEGAVADDLIGYTFTLPKVEFAKGMPNIPGKNTDIMLPIEFTAHRDVTAGYTIGVQRVFKA